MVRQPFRSVHALVLAAALLAATAPHLLSPALGWADVGELPEPGGLVTPGDKTDEIRMKSESVVFSIRPNDGAFEEEWTQYYARVTADFVMENLASQTVTTEVFFPFHTPLDMALLRDPLNAGMLQAKNVRVLVDGREVVLSYADVAFAPPNAVAAALFSVAFPARSETTIRVQYDVRAVHEPKSPSLSFKYMMQTGSHWAGTIGSGKVVFEFWRPVDSTIALGAVNEFFQVTDGRLEWEFADLEPTPDHDITVTFEPRALEAWAGRPAYVKDIRASTPAARGIPDSGWLRQSADYPGGRWGSSPAYLLDAAQAEWGWVAEQADDPGGAWLQFDLDQAHTLAGILIRTGVLDRVWGQGDRPLDVYDTFRRPRTVEIALSDGIAQTVSLKDRPEQWQMVPLPPVPTSSVRLSFVDTFPGTGGGDAFLGIGRLRFVGVDAGARTAGHCAGPNLLRNGDMEQGFDRQGIGLGWDGFSSGEGATYHLQGDLWPRVVYEGVHSQLIAISTYALLAGADRSAGIYQSVGGLEPGGEYELSLAGLLREEAPHPDEDPYRYRVQWALVEVDGDWTHVTAWQDLPWGALYPLSEPGAFSTHTTRLFAPGESATLFIRAWKKWATSGREFDVNLDGIALRRCEQEP